MKRRMFVGAGMRRKCRALAGTPAWAQARITGDVRFYCGFAPGGTADLLCRILADAVKPEIGQNVDRRDQDRRLGLHRQRDRRQCGAGRPDGRTGRNGRDVRVAGDAGPEAADQCRHRPDADRQHRRRLQHAGVRQARAVSHGARADRAGEEGARASSATPRPATARRSIWRANCSRRWPASICCTCPIAAARRPSRTWSPAIAT